jgi:hypothetical protein
MKHALLKQVALIAHPMATNGHAHLSPANRGRGRRVVVLRDAAG